ncbi:hypothetical protein EZS27_037282, partial [termite gut metagenome]
DVSKQSVDVCVLSGDDIFLEKQILGTISEIESFLQSFLKKHSYSTSDVLVCAEYTGKYTYPLCLSCQGVGVGLWLENPYAIKHSCGLERGKNDRRMHGRSPVMLALMRIRCVCSFFHRKPLVPCGNL